LKIRPPAVAARPSAVVECGDLVTDVELAICEDVCAQAATVDEWAQDRP
jgi:hypothetical protein